MDYFSVLMDNSVVVTFTIMIVLNAVFAGYMKYHFIKRSDKK
ncbi:hypothetical protein [Psychromonas ingrahamii]|nr:hypothetical protein [Psychromonas ingrahamii]